MTAAADSRRRIASSGLSRAEAKPSSASIRRRRSPTSVPLSKPLKKYGVKASVWRSSSGGPQRASREARAGRHMVDIVDTNGPELEALARAASAAGEESHLADLIAQPIRPHGEWVGSRINVFMLQHRARQEGGLPKTWEDLADPKWKGKLGIEQEDFDWLAGIYSEIGEKRAKGIQADRCVQRYLRSERVIRCSRSWLRRARCRLR